MRSSWCTGGRRPEKRWTKTECQRFYNGSHLVVLSRCWRPLFKCRRHMEGRAQDQIFEAFKPPRGIMPEDLVLFTIVRNYCNYPAYFFFLFTLRIGCALQARRLSWTQRVTVASTPHRKDRLSQSISTSSACICHPLQLSSHASVARISRTPQDVSTHDMQEAVSPGSKPCASQSGMGRMLLSRIPGPGETPCWLGLR